ncbi:MAG: hypothetical protein V7K62_02575 [Nostoc sp.]
MASSISLGVMGATLPPITPSMNPDANAPTCNFSKSSLTNKIPDFVKVVGDLSFHE